MAKEKMVFFRTALGGFNRDDVNTYIEKLNAEFTERERIVKKKLENADAKCADLEATVSAKNAEQTETNAKLQEALIRIAALEEEAAQREALIGEYRDSLDAQKEEIAALEASRIASESEISELSARIESLSEAICKSEKYDDISGQIGEIILSAKSTAEDIIAKAEKDADAKRAKADEQIEVAAEAFNARAINATASIKSQMKKLAYESYADIAEKAAETSDLLRNLAAHISSASDSLENKLSTGKSDAETAIEKEATRIFSGEDRLTFKR